MKSALSHAIFTSLLIGWTQLSPSAIAAPEEPSPEPGLLEPENFDAQNPLSLVYHVESYRWFINFGTTTRSINADFKFDGHQATLDWQRYINQQSGRGYVGLYRGGPNTVYYDDGFVGPHNPIIRGGAGGYVRNNRQIANNPRTNTGGRSGNKTLTFHTDEYNYSKSLNQNNAKSSDSDVGVGPYFQWGYHLTQFDSVLINFVSGGSYIRTNHSSGNQNIANLSVTEKHTVYTYQYDLLAPPASPPTRPGVINGPNQVIVVDPDALSGRVNLPSLGYRPPRQSKNETNSSSTRFYAMSQADLDVNLSEIPFGFEIGREIGPVDVFLTGGTTVNIINYDLSNSVSWYQSGNSSPIMRQRWRDSGTPVRLGFYSGLSMKVPLKRDGRVLLEAHSSYRWVDPVHASAGIADVEIDPSSWEAGVGIVIILE